MRLTDAEMVLMRTLIIGELRRANIVVRTLINEDEEYPKLIEKIAQLENLLVKLSQYV